MGFAVIAMGMGMFAVSPRMIRLSWQEKLIAAKQTAAAQHA
jgi:hypothetical protein